MAISLLNSSCCGATAAATGQKSNKPASVCSKQTVCKLLGGLVDLVPAGLVLFALFKGKLPAAGVGYAIVAGGGVVSIGLIALDYRALHGKTTGKPDPQVDSPDPTKNA